MRNPIGVLRLVLGLGLAAASTSLPIIRAQSDARLQPENFDYVGAFRLPAGGERPFTFDYGGSAMTFNPDGDGSGAQDGFGGSLFVMGHDRLAYGELPNGNQVAEVSIPAPVITDDVNALPQAVFLQDFHDIASGYFVGLDEIPRVGMLYLDASATGPVIHIAWGQHLLGDQNQQHASHGWFSPTLDTPMMQGPWQIKDISSYSSTGYLLEIPLGWANRYVQGRAVGTGRFRDGGWGGMGPSLFAYRPWNDANEIPADQSPLEATPLLVYATSLETDDVLERSLNGYQHPDEWEGGAWIETETGQTAVLFAGTKSTGAMYWYGFINPAGPELPCIEGELADQFILCRQADGSPCPADLMMECENHTSARGWWSSQFEAQFILYDPADLALVASGTLEPWEPQPYATLAIDSHLFLNEIEPEMVGTGNQRRFRISDVAYDRARNLLYVLELYADGASPVVHVWRIVSRPYTLSGLFCVPNVQKDNLYRHLAR